MTTSSARDRFAQAVREVYGEVKILSRKEILDVCSSKMLGVPYWLLNDETRRYGRGMYRVEGLFPDVNDEAEYEFESNGDSELTVVNMSTSVTTAVDESLIPEKARGYVPFGNFSDVRSIINSNKFYPVYITGLSGNGKTVMVEQVCAVEKREMVRVNITVETDEDDLIGGFRLVNGETVWQDGPVIVAMQRGAILLLDEVDLGSSKMMCLQPVLEGKSVYIKKVNKVVHPENGFNIIATANTKGKGSDDGRFIGTNVMNEAFLERFSITMEQEYPDSKKETKILNNVLGGSNITDKDFVDRLVTWADVIRKSFYDGALSEIISTRRLVHICEAYSIFNQNRTKSLELCLNRFDVDTKNAFMELYKKVDASIDPPATEQKKAVVPDQEVAF